MRDRRRRRVFVALGEHDVDAVRGEHLERARRGRLRQRVRVDAEKERPVDAALFAVAADRLGDRQDVMLVERALERRAAMPRRAEGDALRRDRRVRDPGVVRGDELADVDERRGRNGLAGERADLGGHDGWGQEFEGRSRRRR